MTEEAQIKSVALFYFFSVLDDRLARQATVATARKIQQRTLKYNLNTSKIRVNIVSYTNQYWEKLKRQKKQGHSSISYEAGWLLSESIDIGIWKQFAKESEEDEFLAVIWSQILKFSDGEISEGLGVTEGTVRHRVGRGLKLLGSFSKQE